MLLLISHVTPNRGTADFFRDYLITHKIGHYYLTHPLDSTSISTSILKQFDGFDEVTIKEYRTLRGTALAYVHSFLLTLWVFLRLRKRLSTIYCFGSFNTLPFISAPFLKHKKLIFWGVDYSRNRFDNLILNYVYRLSETLACTKAKLIINASSRQEQARTKYHHLTKDRSIVTPNGIKSVSRMLGSNKGKQYAFLYMGSITDQHGVIDFIRYFYIKNSVKAKMYIIGGGVRSEELTSLINNHDLGKQVIYLGYKSPNEIKKLLVPIPYRLIGVAPYSEAVSDHVYYGDSLKIKEYLSLNYPFITSKLLHVDAQLLPFGYIYDDFHDLFDKIKSGYVNKMKINVTLKNKVLSGYKWNLLCKNIVDRVEAID